MDRDIVEVLISPEAVAKRVFQLGRQVSAAYSDSVPLLVGVLKGCALFMADLVRHLTIPMEMDFIAVSSYAGAQRSGGGVRIVKDLDQVIEGRDVLLIEGIVDTGMTASYLVRNLQSRNPHSLNICTFLDKPARRIAQVPVAFKGFEIPDRFVVGYGLDFRQLYRNLNYIGVLGDHVTGLIGG